VKLSAGGRVTRLHPITWMMLFASAIQLASLVIFAAELFQTSTAMRGLPSLEIAVGGVLVNLGYAAFVEIAYRAWRSLRDARWAQASVSA